MSSRKFEEDHKQRIQELLSKSGLVCTRTPPEVSDSSSLSESEEYESLEEEREPEESAKGSLQEIPEPQEHDIVPQVSPDLFPTPSLRRCLPEHVREIEGFNRIHVLPEQMANDFDAMDIPIIKTTPPKIVIDVLGMLTGCTEYSRSLAEFWFLDTLANLLRRAQEDLMDKPSQAILMAWYCEWMKEMQHFDAADRQRMISRFQDNIISAAQFVVQHHRLPTPREVGVSHEAQEMGMHVAPASKTAVNYDYQCALIDLTNIAHYIFDLFSTDYQYELVRSVFTFTPGYTQTSAPHQMRVPKKLYARYAREQKSKTKETMKKSIRKKEADTEEYLALLELRAREERELEEQERKDQEEWNRRNSILPLNDAVSEELRNNLWPIEQDQPDPDQSLKGKETGKKK